MTDQPILVIGATGKTGARVARKLEAEGLPVRHGARRSITPFDWEDPATWAPVLNGVAKAYVTYFPDLAFPGAVEKLEAFTKVAAKSELKQIVLLSGRGEHFCQPGRGDRPQLGRSVHHCSGRVVCAEFQRRIFARPHTWRGAADAGRRSC